jgi:hypothetical protein
MAPASRARANAKAVIASKLIADMSRAERTALRKEMAILMIMQYHKTQKGPLLMVLRLMTGTNMKVRVNGSKCSDWPGSRQIRLMRRLA